MDGLLLEEVVSGQGIEGEEPTHVTDVGLEDGDVSSLRRIQKKRRLNRWA